MTRHNSPTSTTVRRPMHSIALALVLLLGLGTFVATPALAADDVEMNGQFVWVRDDGESTGDLRAVLTPTNDGEWDVSFHFIWEEEPHVYTGTAKGSLTSGELQGTAISDNEERRMTFKFQGTVAEGTFEGTHGFVRDNGEVRDGGTLTLSRAQ